MTTRKHSTATLLEWIERHAFIGEHSRQMLAFQANLEASQWWPVSKIERFQSTQLAKLLDHACQHVPRYETFLKKVGTTSGPLIDWRWWRELPVLTRDQLQDYPDSLRARELPPGHEEIERLRSSGSTGRAVEVAATNVSDLWQKVLTLRTQVWAGRNFNRTMAVIRKLPPGEGRPPDGDVLEHWGDATMFPFLTGQCVRLAASTEIGEMKAWLERRRPSYLTTYPSIVRELTGYSSCHSPLSIDGVGTLGETVDQELRDLVNERWHCRVFDVYSAEEVGCIAIECPDGGGYHVQSEAVVVEVLNTDGQPCKPGEIGEVVVTPLYNFAMPLLRYAIGDYAEMGGRCRCGRGLPLLKRIAGRKRNMLVLSDGRTYWPSFGTRRFAQIAPILQQQFHQSAPDRLEVRLAVAEPLTADQEAVLKEAIQKALPAPFQIHLEYVAEISRNTGGKFELFTSAVAPSYHERSATTSA
jgi:phenylacetate-CoA ligase